MVRRKERLKRCFILDERKLCSLDFSCCGSVVVCCGSSLCFLCVDVVSGVGDLFLLFCVCL